jgi:hypothetical protein
MPSRQQRATNDHLLPPAPRPAHRHRWRAVCDCLELHRICGSAHCRRTGHCRGDPVACLRAGVRPAPVALREFARSLLQAQEEGLSFDDALEEALGEHNDCYLAWSAGLSAHRRR